MKKQLSLIILLMTSLSISTPAQELSVPAVLTLEDCKERAILSSKDMEQARTEMEMASYDRKIALANYFPNISATGAYLHNSRDIALVSDTQSQLLRNAGTLLQGELNTAASGAISQVSAAMTDKMTQLMTAIQTNPALAAEYMGSPMWQTILGMLQGTDPSSLSGLIPNIADPVNAIGADIDDALHPDLRNIWVGAVTVQQPVFVGGKIIYSNQMAALAEELAGAKYDMKHADIILDVEQAYWQIVSISNKKKLAESYSELLHHLENDVDLSVREGVATESDALQIKVKANEADMLLTKATHGLELSKMLLCKRIGLPLESEITLADEALAEIPLPGLVEEKPLEEIYADRPETRSLTLAGEIYDRKAKVVRADMLPRVALTGSYLISNPNAFNGVQNNWNGGMFSAGVMVSVPIFHGGESLNKYRKAKAEARLYTAQLDDAKEMIGLQVAQQRKLMDEALQKRNMAGANLRSAEENLRKATLGFNAGVVETSAVLGAQTAWLSAHSEYIDTGIELQMSAAALRKAEGNNNSK